MTERKEARALPEAEATEQKRVLASKIITLMEKAGMSIGEAEDFIERYLIHGGLRRVKVKDPFSSL